MKIHQDVPRFQPVTITFETREELKRFCDDIRATAMAHSNHYNTYERRDRLIPIAENLEKLISK